MGEYFFGGRGGGGGESWDQEGPLGFSQVLLIFFLLNSMTDIPMMVLLFLTNTFIDYNFIQKFRKPNFKFKTHEC